MTDAEIEKASETVPKKRASAYRIVLTGDWHLGKRLQNVDLLPWQKKFINNLMKVIENERPHLVVVAGDIYDAKRPSLEAVRTLEDFVESVAGLGLPLLLLAGNHDSPEFLELYKNFLRKENIYVVGNSHNPLEPLALNGPLCDFPLYVMPWLTPERLATLKEQYGLESTSLNALLRKLLQKTGGNCLLVGHFLPQVAVTRTGSSSGEYVEDSGVEEIVGIGLMEPVPEELLDEFRAVFSGHLHVYRRLGKKQQIIFPGSPYPLSLQYIHRGAVLLVTLSFEEGLLAVKEVRPLPLPPVIEVCRVEWQWGDEESLRQLQTYVHSPRESLLFLQIKVKEVPPDQSVAHYLEEKLGIHENSSVLLVFDILMADRPIPSSVIPVEDLPRMDPLSLIKQYLREEHQLEELDSELEEELRKILEEIAREDNHSY